MLQVLLGHSSTKCRVYHLTVGWYSLGKACSTLSVGGRPDRRQVMKGGDSAGLRLAALGL